MNKAIIIYVVALVAVIAVTYGLTGFRFLGPTKGTTSTIAIPVANTSTSTVSQSSTPSTSINYTQPTEQECSSIQISELAFNATYTEQCRSTGGLLGLWVAAGNSGSASVKIVGTDGKTYLNRSSAYKCMEFLQNFTLPAQSYNVTFRTGPGGGFCGTPKMAINTTTTPSILVYDFIYNGNFSDGTYIGWNVTNPGFGRAPLNITYADSKLCYQGIPWNNYAGDYFATTYNCGISVAPGNITSSFFTVSPSKPFLNFRLISPQSNNLYIEILRANFRTVNGRSVYVNSTVVAIAHYNTYNISITPNSGATFANVTLPLTEYILNTVQVRVVAADTSNKYMAAGDFNMSSRPRQDKWASANITTSG
ncbi:MAG: hypothetical protein KGI06_04905 [Candidatus Micrarchaeota archaeon]|nr:hypothetical protein [Candidatus Micrarchaeota archaeon]